MSCGPPPTSLTTCYVVAWISSVLLPAPQTDWIGAVPLGLLCTQSADGFGHPSAHSGNPHASCTAAFNLFSLSPGRLHLRFTVSAHPVSLSLYGLPTSPNCLTVAWTGSVLLQGPPGRDTFGIAPNLLPLAHRLHRHLFCKQWMFAKSLLLAGIKLDRIVRSRGSQGCFPVSPQSCPACCSTPPLEHL